MIEALDWLRSGSSATRLRGGQTPVCWRKDLSQKTASITAMRRACNWVGEIAAISPKLCDGSLFGDCLADLTRPADTSPQPEPEPARPPRKRLVKTEETARAVPQKPEKGSYPSLPSRSKSDCDAPAKSRRRSFQPGEVCPAQSVTRVQPEADRSLLCRLAGDQDVVDTANQRSGEKSRRGSNTTQPVSADKMKSHRDLLCHLAERAGKSLNRSDFRSEFRFQAEGLGSRNRPPEGGTPNFSPANVLADQWALPLNGQSVSSQSLNALANERAIRYVGTDDNPARHHVGESRLSSSSLTAPGGAESGGESWRRDYEGSGEGAAARSHSSIARRTIQTPKSVTNGDDADWPLADQASNEQGGHEETGQWPPAQIVPPSLTPTLPALLPSQLLGATSQPVATAVSRIGARREETEGKPDDLSELAEKIQRILNEEARRHGISV